MIHHQKSHRYLFRILLNVFWIHNQISSKSMPTHYNLEDKLQNKLSWLIKMFEFIALLKFLKSIINNIPKSDASWEISWGWKTNSEL